MPLKALYLEATELFNSSQWQLAADCFAKAEIAAATVIKAIEKEEADWEKAQASRPSSKCQAQSRLPQPRPNQLKPQPETHQVMQQHLDKAQEVQQSQLKQQVLLQQPQVFPHSKPLKTDQLHADFETERPQTNSSQKEQVHHQVLEQHQMTQLEQTQMHIQMQQQMQTKISDTEA